MTLKPQRSVVRKVAALTAAVLVTVGLGACSGQSGSGGSTGSGIHRGDTLVLWDYQQNPAPQEYVKRLSDFTAKTGVKVKRVSIAYDQFLSKVQQAAAAHSLPDIVMVDNPWNSALADQGVLADISGRVSSWGQWNNYFSGPAQSATWNGKVYGVPNESNDLIMYYDKTLLDKAGLQPPTTWDELRTAAKHLTTGGRYGFSTSMTKSENAVFVFESLLWQAGADLDSLSSPKALQAMTYLQSLQQDGSLSKDALTWDLRAGVTQLVNGKSAIAFGGTWDYPWLKQNMKDELGVAVLPAGPAGQASNLGGENWAISATSKHQDEAWKLITSAVAPKQSLAYLKESGQLPARKDVSAIAPFYQSAPMPVMLDQLKVAKARVYGPHYPQMADALMTAYQSVLSGQQTPKAALAQAASVIDPLLAKK
jgi:multiple sugar transport system substrate-binding protein